jgi:hypothetical protein
MFNLPEGLIDELTSLYNNLKECSSFGNSAQFVDYYLDQLSPLYFKQSCIDPTITSQYDLYIQDCTTGRSIILMNDETYKPIEKSNDDGLVSISQNAEQHDVMIGQILKNPFDTLLSFKNPE